MKLQHLAIIFIIIILPISLVVGEYIQAQIDTIYLQTSYSKKLQDATYDAIKAFQLNTINSKYSSLSDSKIRDIEASVSTFYNSLGTGMGASGYDEETLREFIPAMVYTMYDGYYIYGKHTKYDTSKDENVASGNNYFYGLKPYIYYACRYKNGNDDFVINYTLDNCITIYGNIDRKYITKTGYVINPELVKFDENTDLDIYKYGIKVIYDGIEITREVLSEKLILLNDEGEAEEPDVYEYTKYQNQKIYKDKEKDENDKIQYFRVVNNKKEYLSDEGAQISRGEVTPLMYAKRLTGDDGLLYSNSAVEYYINAYRFSTWLQENLRYLQQSHAVDNNGNNIRNNSIQDENGKEIQYFATDLGNEGIFNFSSKNNPLLDNSTFNEHRKNVIRKSIETNLASAIANYNIIQGKTYEYKMPKLKETDWEKLLNNISLSVFMQGLPIKSKIFNSYCIITNDKNKEVVTQDGIYILAEKKKQNSNNDGIKELHYPGCTDLINNSSEYKILNAYNHTDTSLQTVDAGQTQYYRQQDQQRCYNCIVNIGGSYDIDELIEGKLKKYDVSKDEYVNVNKDISELRKVYLTALARERYDLYKSNKNIDVKPE